VQNIKYAFRLIGRCFQLAKEKETLQRPWMYQSLGGLGILLIWFIPLALVLGLIGLRPVGMVLIGLIAILVLISLLVWGEMTALNMCKIFDFLRQDANSGDGFWENHRSFTAYWLESLIFTLASPGAQIIYRVRQAFSNIDAQALAWLDAFPLIQPIMIIDDLGLRESVNRVKEIVRENLLKIRPGFVRVRLVANLVQWLLIGLGILVGVLVGISLAPPTTSGSWRLVLGAGVGLLVGGIFTLLGMSFSTFTRACYHMTLYQWVRQAEKTRQEKTGAQAAPPKILENLFGR